MESIALNILPDVALLIWQGPTFVRVLARLDLAKHEAVAVRRLRIAAMFALADHGIERVKVMLAERLSSEEIEA